MAFAFGQDPLLLRARDVYPFLSGLALFASAGALLGALAAAGRGRPVLGAAGGALIGYIFAVWHVLHPYALGLAVPAVAIVAASAVVGVVAGGVAQLPRRRGTAPDALAVRRP